MLDLIEPEPFPLICDWLASWLSASDRFLFEKRASDLKLHAEYLSAVVPERQKAYINSAVVKKILLVYVGPVLSH